MAIEAAMEADRMHRDNLEERHRMMELDLQQARYEASLAERRYAACDPENRLIAAQLEKSWEGALRRVEKCEAALIQGRQAEQATPIPDFTGIATDLWRPRGAHPMSICVAVSNSFAPLCPISLLMLTKRSAKSF
ncbi:hypothetical protein JOH51_007505 [Rhizobium leguminosarum]|nr:hypothetical protein [Rhizobium leguminosarum]